MSAKPARQNQHKQIVESSTFIATKEHSGPLPDPDTLSRYEQLHPGLAERIISMAENEANSRRSNERSSLIHTIIISYLGIFFAFLSVVIISLLVYYAISSGFDMVAGTIAVGCIATVAGVFVFFRKHSK